jgi:hypothetical protein
LLAGIEEGDVDAVLDCVTRELVLLVSKSRSEKT